MLKFVDNKKYIKSIPHKYTDFYNAITTKLGDDYIGICSYIDNDLPEDNVVVGILYSMKNPAWEEILTPIYFACGEDKLLAGYYLGLLIMDILIHREETWHCVKTNFIKRDFPVMSYFRER